ncbi:MAG: 1-acyl-sn-glycerol-3-phosphate acyltransferase, partial [Alphaproteobacteria bacterium]
TAWTLEGLGWTVLTGYGLTETAPLLTFSAPKRRRVGTEGFATPGVELRIEAEEGAPFGEILARGPNVFAGYWKNPQATRDSFTAEGWFKTGDLGTLDAQGFLTIVGRAKEMIVLPGGENVFPEEVEAAYAETKCIAEIAVMERDGKLFALVVPEPEAIRERGAARLDAVLREEIEAVSLRLPSYRRISGYAVTHEALPRTHLGKLRRHLLPEMLERATRASPAALAPLSPEDRALLANPLAAALYSWLKDRYPGQPVTPDTMPQLDLGIDSLEWVGLTLEMQSRLGIVLTEAALARVMTVRDLFREAVAAAAAPPERVPVTPVSIEEVWLRPTGPLFRALSFLLYWLNRAAMRSLFSLEIVGAGNVPQTGALVLAPNHASYLDPLALAAALPWRRLANAYWAGWTGKLFMTPLQRLFSHAAHVLPIDPDRAPAAGLAYGAETLRRGFALVWFPEGRISPTGEIGPFLPGVGVLLEGAQVPAVPVRIFGSLEALPRTRRVPRLRPITVVFGRPRDPVSLQSAGRGEDVHSRIADGLRQAVLALAPPAPRE